MRRCVLRDIVFHGSDEAPGGPPSSDLVALIFGAEAYADLIGERAAARIALLVELRHQFIHVNAQWPWRFTSESMCIR